MTTWLSSAMFDCLLWWYLCSPVCFQGWLFVCLFVCVFRFSLIKLMDVDQLTHASRIPYLLRYPASLPLDRLHPGGNYYLPGLPGDWLPSMNGRSLDPPDLK